MKVNELNKNDKYESVTSKQLLEVIKQEFNLQELSFGGNKQIYMIRSLEGEKKCQFENDTNLQHIF